MFMTAVHYQHTTGIYVNVVMEKKVDAVNLMKGLFG